MKNESTLAALAALRAGATTGAPESTGDDEKYRGNLRFRSRLLHWPWWYDLGYSSTEPSLASTVPSTLSDRKRTLSPDVMRMRHRTTTRTMRKRSKRTRRLHHRGRERLADEATRSRGEVELRSTVSGLLMWRFSATASTSATARMGKLWKSRTSVRA